MDRIEKTVFLSYRRINIPWALTIYLDLTQHGFDVFFDFVGIASGDFEQVILGNIKARAHFLVLLTPSALERCRNPYDWLRREIETAIESRRNIIPVMLDGFSFDMPRISKQLTGNLSVLRSYNALSLPPAYFLEAMDRLRTKYLNVPLTAVLHPASPAAREAAERQKSAAQNAATVDKRDLAAQAWFERGKAATEHDDKIRFFSEAIRIKPDYSEAYYWRALSRIEKFEDEAAQADYKTYEDLEKAKQTGDPSYRGAASAESASA